MKIKMRGFFIAALMFACVLFAGVGQKEVKGEVIKGTLNAEAGCDFQTGANSNIAYSISDDNGKRINLSFNPDTLALPSFIGKRVLAEGYLEIPRLVRKNERAAETDPPTFHCETITEELRKTQEWPPQMSPRIETTASIVGPQNYLVVRVTFNNRPISMVEESRLRSVVFDSLNGHVQINSSGMAGIGGEVYPEIVHFNFSPEDNVPPPNTHELVEILKQNVNLNAYDGIIIVIPGNSQFAWGSVGKVILPDGASLSFVWIWEDWFNSPSVSNVLFHECGHNFGNLHDSSTLLAYSGLCQICDLRNLSPGDGFCQAREYGSLENNCAMGFPGSEFCSVHGKQVGWRIPRILTPGFTELLLDPRLSGGLDSTIIPLWSSYSLNLEYDDGYLKIHLSSGGIPIGFAGIDEMLLARILPSEAYCDLEGVSVRFIEETPEGKARVEVYFEEQCEFGVGLNVAPLHPHEILPGGSSQTELMIANPGTCEAVYNLSASSSPFLLISLSQNNPTIPAGNSVMVQLFITADPNIPPGTYGINILAVDASDSSIRAEAVIFLNILDPLPELPVSYKTKMKKGIIVRVISIPGASARITAADPVTGDNKIVASATINRRGKAKLRITREILQGYVQQGYEIRLTVAKDGYKNYSAELSFY